MNDALKIVVKPINIIKYILGMLAIAFGVVFMLRSNIGLSSWDTLHYSMHKLFGITIGTAMIILTTLFTISLIIMNRKVKFLISGLPVLIVGPIIDFLDLVLFVDFVPTDLTIRIMSYGAGILLLPLGGAFLLASTFPGGIFDEFMMVVARKLKTKKIVLIRVIMEATAVLTALILGLLAGIGIGQINVGTLIFTFTVGLLVKAYLKLFAKIGLYEKQQNKEEITASS